MIVLNYLSINYQQIVLGATISAPPTTNNPSSSNIESKIATIATTGAASKIIHPAEDISLEEIKARNPKYIRNTPAKTEENTPSTSTSAEVNYIWKIFDTL